jgi:ankyrin repeat protein
MHLSAHFGLENTIKYQLENGANGETRGEDSKTPLLIAAGAKHDGVVRLLLAWDNSKVNSKDTNGRTPLFEAVGFEEVVRLLLAQNDVKVNSKNNIEEHHWQMQQQGLRQWCGRYLHEMISR